jgi:hypothetical protein
MSKLFRSSNHECSAGHVVAAVVRLIRNHAFSVIETWSGKYIDADDNRCGGAAAVSTNSVSRVLNRPELVAE